jgi:hypothetical protein
MKRNSLTFNRGWKHLKDKIELLAFWMIVFMIWSFLTAVWSWHYDQQHDARLNALEEDVRSLGEQMGGLLHEQRKTNQRAR